MSSPAVHRADCPECGEQLWGRRGGQWTLRNRILKLAKGVLHAKCTGCGADVPVPFLQLSDEEQPAPARRRLVMRALDKAAGS